MATGWQRSLYSSVASSLVVEHERGVRSGQEALLQAMLPPHESAMLPPHGSAALQGTVGTPTGVWRASTTGADSAIGANSGIGGGSGIVAPPAGRQRTIRADSRVGADSRMSADSGVGTISGMSADSRIGNISGFGAISGVAGVGAVDALQGGSIVTVSTSSEEVSSLSSGDSAHFGSRSLAGGFEALPLSSGAAVAPRALRQRHSAPSDASS